MKLDRRIAILAGTGAAAGCLAAAGGLVGGAGPERALASGLTPFSSCEDVLDYVDEHRWAVGYGGGAIPLAGGVAIEDGVVAAESAVAAAPAQTMRADAGGGVAPAVGPEASGTNVQEAGIDEPDTVKLSGETLFAVTRNGLASFAVGGDDPVPLGRIELPGRNGNGYDALGYPADPQLLVAGDRALVISQFTDDGWRPRTRLTEIDISDPAAMALVRTMEIEGGYVSGRMRDATAHLVISSTPNYRHTAEDAEPPEGAPPSGASGASGPSGPQPAEATPAWLPAATVTDQASGDRVTEPLFGCEDVSYPSSFAGLGLLSVLTVDLDDGLPAADADAVMTNGQTVYASDTGLYIATESLQRPADQPTGVSEPVVPAPLPATETTIHRFDTSDPLAVEYAASGEVAGRLLSQWSMSEHEGYLRVATTTGEAWAEGGNESESAVTVLGLNDGELESIGRVGGLGRGEQIYAVRFIGPIGFVVTFEETDPLYTLDLSDPDDPRTVGELKIPGYSAYLHPTGGDLLLGVGQKGTDDGVLKGAQASLFDVGDLTEPKRVDQLDLAEGPWSSSATEFDHHAFLYAPDEGLAVLPVSSYGRGGERFQGAVAVSVGRAGELTELARFEDDGGIQRALLVGDRLVTVSPDGVTTRDVLGFEQTGSAGFADSHIF